MTNTELRMTNPRSALFVIGHSSFGFPWSLVGHWSFHLPSRRYSPIHLGQIREAAHDMVIELSRVHSPTPVAVGLTGRVHARLAAEVQGVLRRYDRRVCHRRPREAHQCPGNVLAAAAQVAPQEPALMVR